MCSGPIIGYWITNCCVLLQRLLLPTFSVAYSLCVRPRPCGYFPIQLGMYRSHLGGHNLLTTFIVSNLYFLLGLASYWVRKWLFTTAALWLLQQTLSAWWCCNVQGLQLGRPTDEVSSLPSATTYGNHHGRSFYLRQPWWFFFAQILWGAGYLVLASN